MFLLKRGGKNASTVSDLFGSHVPHFRGTIVSYLPGQEVVGAGDPTNNFFLVMNGHFRAEKFTADGRRQVFAFHMAGDLCGLEPDGIHKLTIEAQDQASMAIVPRSLCRLRMNDHPEISAALFDGATRALTLAIDHTIMIGCGSAEERIAWFLTTLSARSAGGAARLINLPMHRRDITLLAPREISCALTGAWTSPRWAGLSKRSRHVCC